MAEVTVQQILHIGYAAFEAHHPLPVYVRKAVWALMACRTAVLGGHVPGYPDGHVQRVWYHSCRHRWCPPCAGLPIERWRVHQQSRLLACEHCHVILTMPDELRGLWLAHVRAMTTLVCATVRETLCALLIDAKYLGARPGSIAALHTWSQTLVLPPHVHGLVTGGGWSDPGEWRAVRKGFLWPVRVVMAVFRGTWLAALDTAVRGGQFTRPAGMTPRHWDTRRHRLGRQQWNVHIRERYPHGAGVRTSLARYLRGGPFSNTRLVSCAQGEVTCWYRLHGEGSGPARRGRMPLPIAECIRRYLLHVPEPGTRMVRSYGRYAPTAQAAWACGREQLGQGPGEAPAALDWQTYGQERGDAHPERCPVCGRRLLGLSIIPHARVPPPMDRSAEAVA